MKFVADESIDQQIVDQLRQARHQVVYIAEISPSITDEEVLKVAQDSKSILITADKDFGELVFRQNRLSSGIILIRLEGLNSDKKAHLVKEIIQEHGVKIKNTDFCVITHNAIRIRSEI